MDGVSVCVSVSMFSVNVCSFRAPSLCPMFQEKYVCEVSPKKVNMLLLSKADLLSPRQR